jgi:hypothetical protein
LILRVFFLVSFAAFVSGLADSCGNRHKQQLLNPMAPKPNPQNQPGTAPNLDESGKVPFLLQTLSIDQRMDALRQVSTLEPPFKVAIMYFPDIDLAELNNERQGQSLPLIPVANTSQIASWINNAPVPELLRDTQYISLSKYLLDTYGEGQSPLIEYVGDTYVFEYPSLFVTTNVDVESLIGVIWEDNSDFIRLIEPIEFEGQCASAPFADKYEYMVSDPYVNGSGQYYDRQQWPESPYFLPMIHSSLVWNLNLDPKDEEGNPLICALVDVGVDLDHPDIQDSLFLPEGLETDLVDGDDLPEAGDQNHGTACAGIMAASENGSMLCGILPKAKILPIRVSDDQLSIDILNVIYAIDLIKTWKQYNDLNIKTCLISVGYTKGEASLGDRQELHAKIREMVLDFDVICVTGAHNQGVNNDIDGRIYPSSYSTVIAVGGTATDESQRWIDSNEGSNYGPWVDVYCVSGSDDEPLQVLASGGGTYNSSGTSWAAPEVTVGALALCALKPDLTYNEFLDIVNSRCVHYNYDPDDQSDYTPFFDFEEILEFLGEMNLGGTEHGAYKLVDYTKDLDWLVARPDYNLTAVLPTGSSESPIFHIVSFDKSTFSWSDTPTSVPGFSYGNYSIAFEGDTIYLAINDFGTSGSTTTNPDLKVYTYDNGSWELAGEVESGGRVLDCSLSGDGNIQVLTMGSSNSPGKLHVFSGASHQQYDTPEYVYYFPDKAYHLRNSIHALSNGDVIYAYAKHWSGIHSLQLAYFDSSNEEWASPVETISTSLWDSSEIDLDVNDDDEIAVLCREIVQMGPYWNYFVSLYQGFYGEMEGGPIGGDHFIGELITRTAEPQLGIELLDDSAYCLYSTVFSPNAPWTRYNSALWCLPNALIPPFVGGVPDIAHLVYVDQNDTIEYDAVSHDPNLSTAPNGPLLTGSPTSFSGDCAVFLAGFNKWDENGRYDYKIYPVFVRQRSE